MAILEQDLFDQQLLKLVNQARVNAGLRSLTLSEKLDIAADQHAERMATRDFFDHLDPETGTRSSDRVSAAGYDWQIAAENIAAGYNTPAEVFQGWMDSPGHRANILEPSLTHMGLGYTYLANDTGLVNYSEYWVQVFAAGDPNPGTYIAETDSPGSTVATAGNDLLVGTNLNDTLNGLGGADTLKGAGGQDLLTGAKGNDWLYGQEGRDRLSGELGNDVLSGGAGNDYLQGTTSQTLSRTEADQLVGGTGADRFILGTRTLNFYDDGQNNTLGIQNYALINDLNPQEGDRVVLEGQASNYQVIGATPLGVPVGTALYRVTPGTDELIAILQGDTATLNLNSSTFVYQA
jgi:serralysin